MPDAVNLLKQSLSRGESLEASLSELRSHGVTPIEAIKAIREVQEVDLGEAKRIFSGSPAWRVENEAADRMHEELLAELRKAQGL